MNTSHRNDTIPTKDTVTIAVKRTTRDILVNLGRFGQSFDDVILGLIKEKEDKK